MLQFLKRWAFERSSPAWLNFPTSRSGREGRNFLSKKNARIFFRERQVRVLFFLANIWWLQFRWKMTTGRGAKSGVIVPPDCSRADHISGLEAGFLDSCLFPRTGLTPVAAFHIKNSPVAV
jgi:hypothetical protein